MLGRDFKGDVWPRNAIDPRWWIWKTIITYAWEHSEPITTLEARAILNAVRWRGRGPHLIRSKFVHTTDSQCSMGAFSRSRSRSEPFAEAGRKGVRALADILFENAPDLRPVRAQPR